MVSRTIKGRQASRTASLAKPNKPLHSQHGLRSLIVLFAFAVLISVFAMFKLPTIKVFAIKNVKIQGVYTQIDRQVLQHAIMPFLDANMLTVDTSGLQKRLTEIPWVAQVAIKRQWPDKLAIHLVEYQALAQWNQEELLSTTGVIFNPGSSQRQHALPQFNGPEGQQNLMRQNYQLMMAALSALKLTITQLNLSARLSWSLQLDNGLMIILGNTDPAARLQRLIRAYDQIVGPRAADIDYIDLRYPNGIAVRWKTNGASLPERLSSF